MAKKAKAVITGINIALLTSIAQATDANGVVYVTKDQGFPLLNHNPALIEVNLQMIDPTDNLKAASRITQAGRDYIAKAAAKSAEAAASDTEAFKFDIITNAVLPPSKRGAKGGGAPTIYPFDKMEIGNSFFVPISEKHPDPVKTLGSTVSAANMRFAEETAETKEVERTKRGPGNKAMLDAAGNKIKETVTVPVLKLTRKFSLRSVKAGEKYGEWTAPADGALIARVALD